MSNGMTVQYLGFQAKQLARVYSFQVRTAGAEREFTLSIANEAFLSHLARYQDGPDICAQRLQAELTASADYPPETQYVITSAELDSYRTSRAVKPSRYPARHSEM
jgi:hypothetical protein